ncbi:MAG TPA: M3 family metallopeptidase, partial [Draconibacterium sp.]|nr:M3 family metallopeptidase [Draconibacterium sp.]
MKKKFFAVVILIMNLGMVVAQNNPLLGEFKTPHQTAPFNEIKNEHFIPAFQESIKQGEDEIEAIINNPASPTFENTVVALENTGRLLSRTAGVFFNLMGSETNDELQKIAQEVSPMLTKFQNDISLNPDLFAKIKVVYAQKDKLNLNAEQQTLLENSYSNFIRQGANLNDEQKDKFREISTGLSKLSLTFNENVLKETNSYEMLITDKNKLAGLPEGALEAAAGLAKSKNKEGWLFTLNMPSYLPFMKYADNRELRKELNIAYNSKAFKGNEFDNQENVRKLAALRLEMAQLLGYENYADYALERRMAMNQEGVYKLLNDLYEASFNKANQEKAEVQAFAQKSGFEGE